MRTAARQGFFRSYSRAAVAFDAYFGLCLCTFSYICYVEKVEFITPPEPQPYINSITVAEDPRPDAHFNLPLYADGYPGIMFQQADNDFFRLPTKKKLSPLFLYGQTLHPISLDVRGPYRFVVVQLYPFASQYLLGVDPRTLNDECYDLLTLKHIDAQSFYDSLVAAPDAFSQIDIICNLVRALVNANAIPPDDRIQRAIQLIIAHKGQTTVKELRAQLFLTERTLERQFKAQVGLTPKQFARIIQFQTSLRQMTQAGFDKLVEVGLDSGFADQSHFIRTFRKYTGQTLSFYLKAMQDA